MVRDVFLHPFQMRGEQQSLLAPPQEGGTGSRGENLPPPTGVPRTPIAVGASHGHTPHLLKRRVMDLHGRRE